jgi:PKD repeat protein
MTKLLKKSLALMAVAASVAGFSTAQANNNDVLVGFNDAAGPTPANNDYVIDLGMTGPALLTAATNAGGTIVFTNVIVSGSYNPAFSGDSDAANNVAVGAVSGSTQSGAAYLFQTAPGGIGSLPTWTSANNSDWLNAATEAGVPALGVYPSSGFSDGANFGWSQAIAVSPTQQGSGTPNGNFTGNSANPTANLVGGDVVLPFFKSTGTAFLHFTPTPFTQVGTFDINVNSGNVTFSTGSGTPTQPKVTSITGSVTNGFAPLTVIFSSTTTGSITNYVWSFGDGNSVTNTTGGSATNTYVASGSYTVTLTVNGSGGSGSLALANYIVVASTPQISSFGRAGGQFFLNGSNGPAGVQYRVLSSSNIKTPLASWVPVYTNTFSSNGGFSFTNSMTNAASFFKLVSP